MFDPKQLKKKTIKDTPVLEFKKINPTKYRVIVHNAKGEFPVVFSESFHEGWKAYLVSGQLSAVGSQRADSGQTSVVGSQLSVTGGQKVDNGQQVVNMNTYGQFNGKQISKIGSLADSNDTREEDLRSNKNVPERGNLWVNTTTEKSSNINSAEYSRRLGQGLRQNIYSVSLPGEGQFSRSKDYTFNLSRDWDNYSGTSNSIFSGFRNFTQKIKFTHNVFAQEKVSPPPTTVNRLLSMLSQYNILDGNTEDQATTVELRTFINKGWITTLGDGKVKEIKHQKWEGDREKLDYVEKYNIDFVSKNFQDTIQNDNLPAGNIYETWLATKIHRPQTTDNRQPSTDKTQWYENVFNFAQNKKVMQIPDENHVIVNGYANSWNINPKNICEESVTNPRSTHNRPPSTLCIKNADGSYDFEMVIEFWPQRLFYLGLAISGITFASCIFFLAFFFLKNLRNRLSLKK